MHQMLANKSTPPPNEKTPKMWPCRVIFFPATIEMSSEDEEEEEEKRGPAHLMPGYWKRDHVPPMVSRRSRITKERSGHTVRK